MRKRLALSLALVLSVGVLAGCSAKGSNSNEIKVGLDYELSGDVATYGQSLSSGVELGLEEINKSGGVLNKQFKSIKLDNKSDSAEALSVATKLATREKVVAIMGPATSGNVKGASPAATQNKVPLITGSATADDVTVDSNGKVRDYIFKTCFSDSFQGVMMANFTNDDLKLKNVALLVDNSSDYSKGLAKNYKDTFTKLGGNIVAEGAYQSKDTDFNAVLTNIKGKNPDAIFIPGYYQEVGLIIKQARQLGINVPILGCDGFESPKLLEIAGKESLNDVYYSNSYSSMDTSEEVTKFKEAYKAKYNKEPDSFAAQGYDMAYFLADAIKRAGSTDSEKLKAALESTKDFKGVTGTLTIDSNHNAAKSITILKVQNGEFQFVKKLDPKE